MKIPIKDRRVTVNGAVVTHQGTVEILLTKIGPSLNLNVIGEHGNGKKCWCVVSFPATPVEALKGNVTLDTALILECYGTTGNMSDNMVLDLMLQELLISVTFDLFHSGTKTCKLLIRGIDNEIVAEVRERGEGLVGLFSWPR